MRVRGNAYARWGALYVLLALAVALLALCPAPSRSAPAPGCTAPEARQFDFWVGRWRVYRTGHPETQVSTSLIERLYGGCAIRENWMPKSNHPGGSLSAWVPADRGWRQTWADADGSWVEFKGGFDGKAMVLTGLWPQPGHPAQLTRMTYTRGPDGSVRQLGRTSDDAGKTWQPGFDFTYRR